MIHLNMPSSYPSTIQLHLPMDYFYIEDSSLTLAITNTATNKVTRFTVTPTEYDQVSVTFNLPLTSAIAVGEYTAAVTGEHHVYYIGMMQVESANGAKKEYTTDKQYKIYEG